MAGCSSKSGLDTQQLPWDRGCGHTACSCGAWLAAVGTNPVMAWRDGQCCIPEGCLWAWYRSRLPYMAIRTTGQVHTSIWVGGHRKWPCVSLRVACRSPWAWRKMTSKTWSLWYNLSRESGFRAVTAPGLKKKMKDLVLAGQWRHWDVAILCQAAEELEQPEGWKPISFKFHNRSSAMHALVYSFKAQKLMLIPFLVEMAKRISFQWKGAVSKVERLSRGLATMASMKNGTVKYSWIDTIHALAYSYAWRHGCIVLPEAG